MFSSRYDQVYATLDGFVVISRSFNLLNTANANSSKCLHFESEFTVFVIVCASHFR